jgi:uncharacterized protein GlcG (DUF336 family)
MSLLLRNQPNLTLALAKHALEAALDHAQAEQLAVSIAVVDASGHWVHMAHMDNAPLHCRDIALNKARTAAGFGLPTHQWQARLDACSAALRQGLALQPGLALFGGGEPFRHDGTVIGAIGVSGASEAQDGACAQAAVARVAALLGGACNALDAHGDTP